jgi:hypothetical protein
MATRRPATGGSRLQSVLTSPTACSPARCAPNRIPPRRKQGHRVIVIKGDSRAPALLGNPAPIEIGPLGAKLKRGVGKTHCHLAILLLANLAAILPGHSTECVPFLGRPVSSAINASIGPFFSIAGRTNSHTRCNMAASSQGASATKAHGWLTSIYSNRSKSLIAGCCDRFQRSPTDNATGSLCLMAATSVARER